MRREDFITRRVNVAPDANCPTSLFDRFPLLEITCGDEALANYVLRICALCLTAIPYQGLFFLWGRGRNGKGVLINYSARASWRGHYVRVNRVSRFGDAVMKPAFVI